MSWYDGIGSAFGGMVDMFTGMPAGTTATGAHAAADATAASPTAQTLGKATGLTPYMKMLGMTPAPAPGTPAPAPSTAGGDLSFTHGVVPHIGGDYHTSTVSGQDETKGFKTSDGKWQMPSSQHWDATGRQFGNREDDEKGAKDGVKVGAPEIYQPDLSKLDHKTIGQESIPTEKGADGKLKNVTGAGAFYDYTGTGNGPEWQTKADPFKWGASTKIDPTTGEGVTSFLSGGFASGIEAKTGGRAVAMSDDGRYSATAEAGAVGNFGASGSVGLDTKNGLQATVGAGGKLGLYAQGDANAKSQSVKVGGVDYDAGIGVHGDAFVGAKAGMGATVGVGPGFIGAKGNIGAFAGAEAAGDVHANLGPLGAKVGGSVMAGAGIGADGDISYKDGKFHIGGKMFAALGYGGSLSGDVTIDVGAMGKSAYNLGATGLDYAGKGLSAAGHGIYDAGAAGVSAVGNAASAVGSAASSAGHAIADGASSAWNAVTSW